MEERLLACLQENEEYCYQSRDIQRRGDVLVEEKEFCYIREGMFTRN